MLVGTTSDVAPDSFGSLLQIDSAGPSGSIALGRHTASGSGPFFLFHKSRSGGGAGNTVVQSGDTLGGFRFFGADGTDRNSYGAHIACEVDGTPGSNDMPGRLIFSTTADGAASSTERLRIDSIGRLGINGAGIKGMLEVRASGGDPAQLTAVFGANEGTTNGTLTDNTDKACRIGVQNYDTDAKPFAFLVGSSTNGANSLNIGGGTSLMEGATEVKFSTDVGQTNNGGTERMRITTYGDVGIGSSTPFDASWGTEGNAKHVLIKGATYGVLSLEGDNGANTKWSMGAGDGRFYMAYNENDGVHVLDCVRSTRDIEAAAGNFVLRTAAKGIDFAQGGSVGTAANILDEYEEGTWTPVINKSGDAGSITGYTNQVGRYVKIGQMLWISFYVYKSSGSFGSLANAWYISGIPFPLEHSTSGAYQSIPCAYFHMNGAAIAQDAQNNRWQSNSINGNQTLTMYGNGRSTNWASSSIEMSGTGVLRCAS